MKKLSIRKVYTLDEYAKGIHETWDEITVKVNGLRYKIYKQYPRSYNGLWSSFGDNPLFSVDINADEISTRSSKKGIIGLLSKQ